MLLSERNKAMKYEEIIYEVDDHLAIITLNRPENFNSFTPEMLTEWEDALLAANKDDDVWVVMLTGAGRTFSSGGDVSRLEKSAIGGKEAPLFTQRDHFRESVHRIPRAVEKLVKPYIAAVNGHAVGAGMDMANMADIRICSEKAKWIMGYINMGVLPGDGGAFYLPRIIGTANTYEMIWLGEPVDAAKAKEIGLVSHVFPAENFREHAITYCKKFTKKPALAVQLAKRAVKRGLETNNLDVALEYMEWYMLLCRSTEDAKEGPRAFLEKRKPRFKGR